MEESNAPVPRIESTDESGMPNLPALPAIVDLPLTPALPAIVDLPLMQDWTEAVNGSSHSINREQHELQEICQTDTSRADKPSPEAHKKTRSRISYMHKCG
jgi:hypothetical protein